MTSIITHAAEFDIFQMPEVDMSLVENEINEEQNWKKSIAYSFGVDTDNTTVINRLSLRLQWDGLINDKYWVIDTKARVYDDHDMQHESEQLLDYDLNLSSLFFQHSKENYSIKTGYQTTVFGFMELVNVSNIFTPQDFSEAFFTSPEDARLGQAIINSSWYLKDKQLDIFINLAPVENRYPRSNLRQLVSDFLLTTDFSLNDELPDAFESPEIIFRWQAQSQQHEYQFYLGSLLQNDPNLLPVSFTQPFVFELEYPRYEFVSAAYSYTKSNHQFKLEASYKNNIKPIDAGNTVLDESTLALGWEYDANGDYSLLVESAKTQRDIDNSSAGFITLSLVETELDQTALIWRKNFLNETLTATLYFAQSNPGHIEILSASLRYTPVDDWIVELITTEIESDNNAYDIFNSQRLIKASFYW